MRTSRLLRARAWAILPGAGWLVLPCKVTAWWRNRSCPLRLADTRPALMPPTNTAYAGATSARCKSSFSEEAVFDSSVAVGDDVLAIMLWKGCSFAHPSADRETGAVKLVGSFLVRPEVDDDCEIFP